MATFEGLPDTHCCPGTLTNQISHFYSSAKNTTEMIRMMDLLVEQYSRHRTLYLSWDAASWHISRRLMKHIDQHNVMAVTKSLPDVKMAPLPAGAQFLNVIESVFSGMGVQSCTTVTTGHSMRPELRSTGTFKSATCISSRTHAGPGTRSGVRSANVPCLRRGTIARTPTTTGSRITTKSWLGISPNSSFWHRAALS